MASVFGSDFSDVRAHVGQSAALDGVGARAVARGDVIAFGPASPDPGLVAHEVVHVQQQRQAGASALAASRSESSSTDPAEREAEVVAAQVVAGAASVSVSAAPTAGLHFARDHAATTGADHTPTAAPKESMGAALAPHQLVAAATFLGSLADTFHAYPHPLLLPNDARQDAPVSVAITTTAIPPTPTVPRVTVAWKVTHPDEHDPISAGIHPWPPIGPLMPIGFEVWREGTYHAAMVITVEGYGERREIVTLSARRPTVAAARALDDGSVMDERREMQSRLATEENPRERSTLQDGYNSLLWVSHERDQPTAANRHSSGGNPYGEQSLPDDAAGMRVFVEQTIAREGFDKGIAALNGPSVSVVPGVFEFHFPGLANPLRATAHQRALIDQQLALIQAEGNGIREGFRITAKQTAIELLLQSDRQLLSTLTGYGVPYATSIHQSALLVANDGDQVDAQTEALLQGAKGGSAEASHNYAGAAGARAQLAAAARTLAMLQVFARAAREREAALLQQQGEARLRAHGATGANAKCGPDPAPSFAAADAIHAHLHRQPPPPDNIPIHVEALAPAAPSNDPTEAEQVIALNLATAQAESRRSELALKAEWAQAERAHPLLVAFRSLPGADANLAALQGGDDEMMRHALRTVLPKLGNVIKARTWLETGHLDPLKLELVIPLAKQRMHVAPGSIRAAAVDQLVAEAHGGIEAWIIAALTLAMGVVAIAPTGGSSLPAAIELSGLALDAYLSTDALNAYHVQSVATDTSIDPALALSNEEPSLTWLAVQLVGSGIGAAFAAKAFRQAAALRRAAEAGEASQAAIRELNEIGQREGLGDVGSRVAHDGQANAGRTAAHDAEEGAGRAIAHEGARTSDALGGLAAQNPDALARRLGTGVEIDASLGSGVTIDRIAAEDGEIWIVGLRIGPEASVADVLAHQKSIGLLRRYNGRLGKLRSLLDNLTGGPLGRGAMHGATPAGRAAIELDKLRRVVGIRQAALTVRPIDELAGALEQEIAFLDEAIDEASVTVHAGDVAIEPGTASVGSPDLLGRRRLAEHDPSKLDPLDREAIGGGALHVEDPSAADAIAARRAERRASNLPDRIADGSPEKFIPSGGDQFIDWFDALTEDELRTLLSDPAAKDVIAKRIRQPGGLHEWLMVSEMKQVKHWGVSMRTVMSARSRTEATIGKLFRHGGDGSGRFHLQLSKMIKASNTYDEFLETLNQWADSNLFESHSVRWPSAPRLGRYSLPDDLQLAGLGAR
jgi:filamentous hemagglutinin